MVDDGQGGGSASGGSGTGAGDPGGFEGWLAQQPEEVRQKFEAHTSGLKNALAGERERSKTLAKDLREAASRAEKGSETEKKLSALAEQMGEAERKGNFYEQAVAAGVANIKLAYVAAKQDDLFKKDGNPDFEALKRGYPELFIMARPASNNGGSGTGSTKNPGSKTDMNSLIRERFGFSS